MRREAENDRRTPRCHRRLFSGGERCIHLVSRDGTLVVLGASVKGQCARHKLYGDLETENRLQRYENSHALVYRAVQQIAAGSRHEPLRTADAKALRHALLLQHARTPRYAEVHSRSGDQMALYTYHEYLDSLLLDATSASHNASH